MSMTTNTPTTRPANVLIARAQGMMAQLGGLTQQPSVRRALPAIVIVTVTGIALALWLLASEPPRRPLYPGLPEAEKAKVIETLAASGISAEIDSLSGEVAVARDDYYRARMALATAGVPSSLPDGDAMLSDMRKKPIWRGRSWNCQT